MREETRINIQNQINLHITERTCCGRIKLQNMEPNSKSSRLMNIFKLVVSYQVVRCSIK